MSDRAPSQRRVGVVVVPDPSPELARSLDLAGLAWIGGSLGDLTQLLSTSPGATVIVAADSGMDVVSETVRLIEDDDVDAGGVLALVPAGRLADFVASAPAVDDFCLTPFHSAEFEARLARIGGPTAPAETPDEDALVRHGPLVLNVETYQAAIAGRPLDLTYMEYELLKFLAQSPGKVFTRASLLSEVWGYDYYGGARTVDVHVRRLRAKLGEEHSNLIQTVRSVGYKLGEGRWPR